MQNTLQEENISKFRLSLNDLPQYVLEHIFGFCNLEDLGHLSVICKRFNSIIKDEFLWKERCKNLITSQTSSEIILRSSKLLKPREKCRIAINWQAGYYLEKTYLFKMKYLPWLLLESDRLWISEGNSIFAFHRTKTGVDMKYPIFTLHSGHPDDIRRFIKAHDMIFSCGQDMQICCWSTKTGELIFKRSNCHEADILSIDVNQQVVVTGSQDDSIKIWRLYDDISGCVPVSAKIINDRVWCVAINPLCDKVACGSSGQRESVAPLHCFDLESGMETTILDRYTFKTGAAIFDLKWECENILLTCGYDSYIRMFDTRVGGCVGMWMDPFDAAGYCLASDKLNYILCGTSMHGRVQLWDKRMLYSIQAFFGLTKRESSPVYSVTFDPCQMFIALDRSLSVMDFTGELHKASNRRNYRHCWGKKNFVLLFK